MSELLVGRTRVDPPYLLRKYGVSEAEYDALMDEDLKAELIDGVLIMHSPASLRHERLFAFLLFLMFGFADSRGLGRVVGSRFTMRVSGDRKFEPDLLFVRASRESLFEASQLSGPADLVVEILSESTRDYDLDDKRRAYREAGIPEIWFVDDQNKLVIVDRKNNGEYGELVVGRETLHSSALTGFWIDASWLWQQDLPNPVNCLTRILESAGQ